MLLFIFFIRNNYWKVFFKVIHIIFHSENIDNNIKHSLLKAPHPYTFLANATLASDREEIFGYVKESYLSAPEQI